MGNGTRAIDTGHRPFQRVEGLRRLGSMVRPPLFAPTARRPAPAYRHSNAIAHAGRNNFAALRLIAALLVVYGHQTADATGTFGLRLVMFFSIGGFLIAGSWHSDPEPVRFLVRRFLRIWPAYAAVIVVCAVASWFAPAGDMPELSQLASMFYLSNLWFSGFDWGFFPAHVPFMNQSIWMVRFEVDIYIAFAAIAVVARGRCLRVVAAALVLAALRAPAAHPEAGGLLACWSLYFSGFFAAGVLLRECPWLRSDRAVLLALVAGTALLWAGERTAGLLLVVPPASVWIGERSWPVLRSANRFGDLSLGIFLWGWPVQQVTRSWLPVGTPIVLQLTVVLALVLPLAWLSWTAIEAPALRRKPTRRRFRPSKDFDDLVTG